MFPWCRLSSYIYTNCLATRVWLLMAVPITGVRPLRHWRQMCIRHWRHIIPPLTSNQFPPPTSGLFPLLESNILGSLTLDFIGLNVGDVRGFDLQLSCHLIRLVCFLCAVVIIWECFVSVNIWKSNYIYLRNMERGETTKIEAKLEPMMAMTRGGKSGVI